MARLRLFFGNSATSASSDAAGSSSGVATVSGVGASVASGGGSSSGLSTASGVGASTAASSASSAGVASVSGVGASVASSTGSSAGVATVSGVGDSTSAGSTTGASSGTSTVSGVGASVAASVGSASGISTVSGVSDAPEVEESNRGGDDAPYRVIVKKRKKTLRQQPNKHLESIFEKAVKDVYGETRPTLKLNTFKELAAKDAAVPSTIDKVISNKNNELSEKMLASEDAEKVSELLALYQQQIHAIHMQDDEDLLMLIAEMY